MEQAIIDALVASGAGGVSGWLTASLRLRKAKRKRRPTVVKARRFPEVAAEAAAREWATRRDVPEAAQLIMNKLRLGWQLSESRRRNR
jgi:hypothetical protein